MSTNENSQNRVRVRRLARDWSQAELAERAGISRAAVSAIEGQRLVPSVATALALASVLECSVEELFGVSPSMSPDEGSQWAWTIRHETVRFWCGSIQRRMLFYPVEETPLGELPHDGFGRSESLPALATGGKGSRAEGTRRLAENTLVMAGCDPASGLLARMYEQATGYRMLVFPRASRRALELLNQGLVHVAGVHLATADHHDGNVGPVKTILSQPARLIRVTEWEDGVAVASSVTATTVRGLLKERLTWVGREPGSGARQCLDELMPDRPAPKRIARDHRGVAEAVHCGWADAGVCLKLVADEANLRFFPIRTEGYDLCFTRAAEDDPRVQALVRVIQSREFRQLVGELPGYDSRHAGELCIVD